MVGKADERPGSKAENNQVWIRDLTGGAAGAPGARANVIKADAPNLFRNPLDATMPQLQRRRRPSCVSSARVTRPVV